MMIEQMGLHECDSFEEQDIETLQQELELVQGPFLQQFSMMVEENRLLSIGSIDIIKNMAESQNKDVRFVGNDEYSEIRAFCFVLLMIGIEQKRNYPHLNTLIREQFYKPDIFRGDEKEQKLQNDEAQQMLKKCLNYFEEVSEGSKIEQFMTRQPLFEKACIFMLKNSLQQGQKSNNYQQLCRKFNIDIKFVVVDEESECFMLGAHKNYYIIRESKCYFIGLIEGKEDANSSKFENDSVRSIESGIHAQVEASDNSTPKFKNSEAKYRKKSHKNSFGGDMEIVQYRDLLHVRQQQMNNNKPKVLSQYFQVGELASCLQNLETEKQLSKNRNTFQDIIDNQICEMKGSTMEPSKTFNTMLDRRKDRKISSSEIIEYRDFANAHNFAKNQKDITSEIEEMNEKDSILNKQASYKSLVIAKEQTPNVIRMRTSLISNKQLQRIQQRQSSQRQSTHPDQSSQITSQAVLQMLDNDSQVKIKDRKYSYFTQQMASTKTKKQKEIESNDYVFKIPKNIHKNSEVIMPTQEQEFMKRRFAQNPLRFSQLGGAPSDESARDTVFKQDQTRIKIKNKPRLDREVYSYQIKFQPYGWFRKEIIYYFDDRPTETYVFERTFGAHIPQPSVSPPTVQKEITVSPIPSLDFDTANIRESFGSVNTMLSQFGTKQSDNYSCNRQPSHTIQTYNPYQINETSFLKNRISSQTFLEVPKLLSPKSQCNIITFPTSKSLSNIRGARQSPKIRINFNYVSPRANTQKNIQNSYSFLPTQSSSQSTVILKNNLNLISNRTFLNSQPPNY